MTRIQPTKNQHVLSPWNAIYGRWNDALADAESVETSARFGAAWWMFEGEPPARSPLCEAGSLPTRSTAAAALNAAIKTPETRATSCFNTRSSEATLRHRMPRPGPPVCCGTTSMEAVPERQNSPLSKGDGEESEPGGFSIEACQWRYVRHGIDVCRKLPLCVTGSTSVLKVTRSARAEPIAHVVRAATMPRRWRPARRLASYRVIFADKRKKPTWRTPVVAGAHHVGLQMNAPSRSRRTAPSHVIRMKSLVRLRSASFQRLPHAIAGI